MELDPDHYKLSTGRNTRRNKEIDIKIIDIDNDGGTPEIVEQLTFRTKKEIFIQKKIYLDKNGKEVHDKSKQIQDLKEDLQSRPKANNSKKLCFK